MPHPPPPWTLHGQAVHTLQLIDIARARSFMPPAVQIVPILPGKTLGVVYFARYEPGSTLAYHELIVAPALTRVDTRVGFWISHIYVDHPDSVQGGRAIWGLPKELAEFTWALTERGEVTVRQADAPLCALRGSRPGTCLAVPLLLPVLSQLDAALLWFRGTGSCCFGFGRGTLDVPATSPFAALSLGRTGRLYHLRDMRLVTHAPRPVGQGRAMVE